MITRNRIATMMLVVLTLASWNAADASQKMHGSSRARGNGKVPGTCGQPGCLLVVVHSHSQAHITRPAVNAKPSPKATYRKTRKGGSSIIEMKGKVTTRTPAKPKVSVKRSYRRTKKGD